MKTNYFTRVSLGFLLCLLIAVAGCFYTEGCIPTEKYERIVRLSAPLSPGGSFEAQTRNGYINITGADVTECALTATVIARAMTEEDAKKLAEEIKIKLEPFGNKLTVKIEKPTFMRNQSVCVNLDVTVPNHTDTELTTHNGAIRIANITGEVNGTTHNGKVTTEKVSGTIKLRTHNGKIICEEVSGDIQLETHNGGIKAFYSQNAPPICNVSMITHNGSVTLTTPPNFSAKVEASTHNGSIDTDLPITVTGKVTKRKLTGTIGTGQGKLHLETHNGSIKIR